VFPLSSQHPLEINYGSMFHSDAIAGYAEKHNLGEASE
jgi:hypothetical protein